MPKSYLPHKVKGDQKISKQSKFEVSKNKKIGATYLFPEGLEDTPFTQTKNFKTCSSIEVGSKYLSMKPITKPWTITF